MDKGPENNSKTSIPDDDLDDFVLRLDEGDIIAGETCNEEVKDIHGSSDPDTKNEAYSSNCPSESKEIINKAGDTEKLAETEKVIDTREDIDLEKVEEMKEVKDLEKVIDTKEVTDLEKVVGTEEVKDLEKVLDTKELTDLEKVVDTSTDSEKVVDMKEVTDFEKVADMKEVTDLEKVVDTKEVADLGKFVDTKEVTDLEKVVDMKEITDLQKVVEMKEDADLNKVVDKKEITDLKKFVETKEVTDLEKVNERVTFVNTKEDIDIKKVNEMGKAINGEKVINIFPEDSSSTIDNLVIKSEKLDNSSIESLETRSECSSFISDSTSTILPVIKVEKTEVHDGMDGSEHDNMDTTELDITDNLIKQEKTNELESNPVISGIPDPPENSMKTGNNVPAVEKMEESDDIDSVDKELDSLLGSDIDDIKSKENTDKAVIDKLNIVQTNEAESVDENGIVDEEMPLAGESNMDYDSTSQNSCDSRTAEILQNEQESQTANEKKLGRTNKRTAELEDPKESSLGSKSKKVKTEHEEKQFFSNIKNCIPKSPIKAKSGSGSDESSDSNRASGENISTSNGYIQIPETIDHEVDYEKLAELMEKRDKLLQTYFNGDEKVLFDRDVLEEVVMTSVAEYLCYSSPELAKCREKARFMEKELTRQMKMVTSLKKQLEDAKYIIKKFIDDKISAKQQGSKAPPVYPLKVTRSVGLQVATVGPITVINQKAKEKECVRELLKQAETINQTLNAAASANNNNSNGSGNKAQENSTGSSDVNSADKNDDITFVSEQPAPSDSSTVRNDTRVNFPTPVTKPSTPNGLPSEASKNTNPKNVGNNQPVSATIDLTDNEDEPPSKPPIQNGPIARSNPNPKPSTVVKTPSKLPTTPNGPSPMKNGPSGTDKSTDGTKDPKAIGAKKTALTTSAVLNNYVANQLPKLPPSMKYPPDVIRPPRPVLRIGRNNGGKQGIMLSWNFDNKISYDVTNIVQYQLYACQEREEEGNLRIDPWKKVGDIKALPLPMACFLTQFVEGNKYHFIVRGVDKKEVLGEFSLPGSIILHSAGDVVSSIVPPR